MKIEITTILAIWGAILSTVLAIQRLQENRRRLKVDIGISVAKTSAGVKKYLFIQATNISKRPISLSSYGLLSPDGNVYLLGNESPDPFPTQLEDGEATEIWMDLERIKDVLKEKYTGEIEIRGFFIDVTRKRYLSKKYSLDLEDENKVDVVNL